MPVTLFDSLTRSPKQLRPSQPDGVYRFYNCGPTVYAPAHIGNFRTFVVNDLLRRVLELEFGPDKVKHVRNITDVDDKTIRRSREESRPLAEVTQKWTDKFHADCDALNCLRPHVEPTATGHIPEQVGMIAELMQKGHAYATGDGSVYFKVGSFPGYGALSRVKERELQIGTALSHKPQTADADEKEDGSDFALWKAWKPEDGDVKWPGPAGAAAGRPGWHIECSAMSRKHLGETIDLHTGGEDLLFPHHENEIAQTECCTGHAFALHWYHSKHLMVDGAKMSKSLGNLYTLDDLKAKGFTPMALRYALLAGHPRKQLNFTLDSLHAATSALGSLSAFHQKLIAESVATISGEEVESDLTTFWDALKDDLNTPAALGALFAFVHKHDHEELATHSAQTMRAEFERALFALGLRTEILDSLPVEAANIATRMWRDRRNVATRGAGELELQKHGILFEIARDGFILRQIEGSQSAPAEVVALAEQRWAAKQAKNWAEADRLRGAIAALGWAMLDSKTDYKLEPAKKV